MSKEKETVTNPFESFNILKGVKVEDISDNQEIVETKEDETKKAEEEAEKKRLAEAEAKLKEVVEIQSSKSKEKTEQSSETEDTTKVETEEVSPFRIFAEDLAKRGAIEFDPEKDEFEDSDEGIANLVDKTVETRTVKGIEEYIGSLPDDIQRMIEFREAGGNPKEFYDIYYGNRSWKDFNIESESNQELVVAESLRMAGWDEKDIAEEIKDYRDFGRLEDKAKRALPKLIQNEESAQVSLVEQTKKRAEAAATEAEERFNKLQEDWFKKENLAGFKLTESVKKKVWDHFTKPVDRKTGMTQLQLNIKNNPDSEFLFAYLDSEGWDISKLEKIVEAKKTSELRDKLSRYQGDTSTKMSKGRTKVDIPKEDENPFEAFIKNK